MPEDIESGVSDVDVSDVDVIDAETTGPSNNPNLDIIGYRALSVQEVDLINEIKSQANNIGVLASNLHKICDDEDHPVLIDERSLNIGITYLQDGFTRLVRSVAKPDGF